MLAKNILTSFLAISMVSIATLSLPSVEISASTNGRITITNNATGDPGVVSNFFLCIDDELITRPNITPGDTVSRDLAPGDYRVKILKGVVTNACLVDTTNNPGVLFEQDVTVTENNTTEVSITGSNVVVDPVWDVSTDQRINSFNMPNNSFGIFVPSSNGNSPFTDLSSEDPMCVNGILSYPTSRETQVSVAGTLGYINVFSATSPFSTISYGKSVSILDADCDMQTLYPSVYPRTIAINNDPNSSTTGQLVYEVTQDPQGLVNKTIPGLNFTVNSNAGIIDQTPMETDTDSDGTSDIKENSSPNNGDANNDSIQDSTQQEVVSASSVAGYVSTQVNPQCGITGEFPAITYDPSFNIQIQDSEYDYPGGLVSLNMPCSQANVKIIWYGIEAGQDYIYRKYGPTTPGDRSTFAWYDYPATITEEMVGGENVVTAEFTLNDGQFGDDTGVDSLIIDPGGLAVKKTTTMPLIRSGGAQLGVAIGMVLASFILFMLRSVSFSKREE
ncbi:MAG: hypothetical protein AAGF07_03605 [Patescibacteria group bacterium]